MSDIFVSYAREDRDRVAPLVAELESAGFSLWWDSDISPGHSFSARIEEELDAAGAVIVAWSKHSVGSNWVQAEATEGLDRGVLVPVLLDDSRVPLPFRRLQSAAFQHYPRKPEREQIEQLKAALATLLDKKPASTPETSNASKGNSARRNALLWLAPVIAIGLAFAVWLWPREQVHTAISSQFFFEPVADTGDEASRALGSLVEEVAIGLQRLPGISVTLPDAQALPSGLSVETTARDESVSVRVVDSSAGKELLSREYDTDGGLNVVQDQIADDLAGLLGSSAPKHSFTDASAFRDYLVVTSMLRGAPTISLLTKAERELSLITGQHPRFARAYAQLCSVQITLFRETSATEKFEGAERNCHRALTLDSADPEVRLSLGRLYMEVGQPERALDEIRAAGSMLSNSSRVYRFLGQAFEVAGADQEALAAYQQALAIEPKYWRNANSLGGYFFKRADYGQAAKYYGIETDLVRNKTVSFNNLAGALFMAGEEDAAIAAWQASAEIELSVNTAMNLGSALFYQKDFSGSAQYYEAAKSLAPEDQRVYGHLADALMANNDPQHVEMYRAAIKLADRQLALSPGDTDVLYDLASYHAALGDREASLEAMQKGPELAQLSIDNWYDRLVVFTRLGNISLANESRSALLTAGYPVELLRRDQNLH